MVLQAVSEIASMLNEIVFEPLVGSVLVALTILGIGFLVGIFVRRAIGRVATRFFPRDIASLISRISYYGIMLLAGLIAVQKLGIDVTALAVAGGFAGLVLSFALQPVLSNFFSGLYLHGEKSLVPGDLVRIGGHMGRVIEVNTMSTRLRSLDGEVIRIPNSKIIGEYMVNYSKSAAMRLTFEASIAYREDIGKAVETIRRALDVIYLVLGDPPPEVFASEMGDSGIIIKVRVWVPTDYWYQASMQVVRTVREALGREGIEIPFNQVDVWLRTPLVVEGRGVQGSG
ncbi:MAG: mechanosensitive ion channel family protein [Aeropyrum sp.]|nr:mechanosensitive ion channel family protein [Aeropyrum sp.]MCE4616096.1 mechanosensitive ion channel family protein [Aeropyrum sp.]